jgi:hypothetical protein
MMKVQVKVKTEKGKCLLSEIHPSLKEGDIILVSKYTEPNGCIDFKWKGADACLWLNENCEFIKTRKKPINSK